MPESTKRIGIGLAAVAIAIALGVLVRSKGKEREVTASSGAVSGSNAPSGSSEPKGLSAPIAAAHLENGDVLVAGLDASARSIRVKRIDAADRVVADRVVLDDVTWSSDADLRVSPRSVVWRGLRGGKLVRKLVILGPDLAPKGEAEDVPEAWCATRDAFWLGDRAHAVARPWDAPPWKVPLPKDEDAALLCGSMRAFAVLDGEDRTSITALPSSRDALSVDAAAAETRLQPVTVLRESEHDDEPREVTEYTVGDDVGVVRLGASGALSVREISGGRLGALHKLKSTIPKDDDVVAVDASSKLLVITYTKDASSSCPPRGSTDVVVSTRVTVLRVDRETFAESTVELSPGTCGHEVGPFFTGTVGDGVSVAWIERSGGIGQPRAPIVGLSHALVAPAGAPTLARVAQAADALVDAGCDGSRCWAVALARSAGDEAAAVGLVKVLRYE